MCHRTTSVASATRRCGPAALAVGIAVTLSTPSLAANGDPMHTAPSSHEGTGQDRRAGSHVRTEDAALATVIRDGLEQSATFRDLVTRIDRASGFVYVVAARCVARTSEPRACLDHRIRVSGGFRFLQVNVHPSESGATLLALIAHELQHALEVLSDDTITTSEDVQRLYERIGTIERSGIVETGAALRMQRLVLREARASLRAR